MPNNSTERDVRIVFEILTQIMQESTNVMRESNRALQMSLQLSKHLAAANTLKADDISQANRARAIAFNIRVQKTKDLVSQINEAHVRLAKLSPCKAQDCN